MPGELVNFEPVITDFATSTTGVKFQKDVLVTELLSLGNTKLTRQIANLVGDEVEKEIHRRRIQYLSAELISEMVASKLEELGLIRIKEGQKKNEKKEDIFTPELLEVISPAISESGLFPPPTPQSVAISLGDHGKKLLERCCAHDENGDLIETVNQLLSRVARSVAEADARYNPVADLEGLQAQFFNLMAGGEFLPEFSVFLHAGRSLGQILSEYVLPINDTTESIFETMKQAAQIHKKGGSAGFSFTHLRPRKDIVGKIPGKSSGPVTFLNVFRTVMEMIFQDEASLSLGRGVLLVNHPDILDFIGSSFNPTVAVTDHFIRGVEENRPLPLINPRTGSLVDEIPARRLFTQIISRIRDCGAPHILFFDRIQEANPTPREGLLEAVTPHTVQSLLAFETVAVGALNLRRHIEDGKVYWGKLRDNIRLAVHFLDNIMEVNHYPVPESARISQRNRKMALSLMGWGSFLKDLKIPYGSEESFSLAEKMASFINREAVNASVELARQRGVFGNFTDSIYFNKNVSRRHASLTAVPDIPYLADIAVCSEGIAPEKGERHPASCLLRMQATFQKFFEGSVSLKIPISLDAKNEDIGQIFLNAHHMGVKHLSFSKEESKAQLDLPEMTGPPLVIKPLQEPEAGRYFRPLDDAEI